LFILLIVGATAQEIYNPWELFTTESNTLNHKLTGKKYHFHSVLQGTVYLDDEWRKGALTLENGDRYDSIYMKYNTYLEELIVYNERTGAIFMPDKSIISEFTLDTGNQGPGLFRKIYFGKYPKGEHYFNVLYEGEELKLFVWHKTDEVKISLYKDEYGLMRDSEFRMSTTYFLVFPDNDIRKITPTRGSFVQLFPEQKKSVRRLLRKNHVSFESNSKIIQAVRLIENEFFSK
jgi:hypothetical protein